MGLVQSLACEALAKLDAIRITERRPKSGIYLCNAIEDGGLDVLGLQANFGLPFDHKSPTISLRLRSSYVEQVVWLAYQRWTEADFGQAPSNTASLRDDGPDHGDMTEVCVEFHLMLIAANKNFIADG